jgi:LmbE family N-acetylglucosaminyl deacetylase
MVIAHPDDEVIFGWPVLRETKKIICCVSDRNNILKKKYNMRIVPLLEIGKIFNIEIICLEYNSGFYKTIDARKGELITLQKSILKNIGYENVFTHNAWGEYGHLDHILVNQLVMSRGFNTYVSNINCYANWFKTTPHFFKERIGEEKLLDMSIYTLCKNIYIKYDCWSWSSPVIEKAIIYKEN